MRVARLIDGVIEAPIVTSFTNIGYEVRRRVDGWTPLDSYDSSGRVIAITGGTSGLGMAAAQQFAANGAEVVLIARNPDKTSAVVDHLRLASGRDAIHSVNADLADFDQVRGAAEEIRRRWDRLDVLIHNAGALFGERRTAPSGIELTTAVQVVAPFILTTLLFGRLRATGDSRVVTMSSGGMYATGLTVDGLAMGEDDYRGTDLGISGRPVGRPRVRKPRRTGR